MPSHTGPIPTAQQGPQSSVPPQPSGVAPQSAPAVAHVFGVHPHWLAMPAPAHVAGGVQPPQFNVALHPSPIGPHCAPRSAQVFGVQGPSPQ
jgi:hypothetical protein